MAREDLVITGVGSKAGSGQVEVNFAVAVRSGEDLGSFTNTRCSHCSRLKVASSIVSCTGPDSFLRKANRVETWIGRLEIGESASVADVLDVLRDGAKCSITTHLADLATRQMKAGDLVEKRTGV